MGKESVIKSVDLAFESLIIMLFIMGILKMM